jgi:hypothetical protein
LHRAAATFPNKQSAERWLQDEQDMLDLDRRKPGSWTPPGQRVTASLSGGPVTARRAGTARVTSLEQVLRQRRHIGALPAA